MKLSKIHTGTNHKKFGDGFFAVYNPDGARNKMKISTSNTRFEINNWNEIEGKLGRFQCIQVRKKNCLEYQF